MNKLELFAFLRDGNGGLARIYCDFEQHFVFEASSGGIVRDRRFSSDPRDFHDYTRTLGRAGWSFAWAEGEDTSDDNGTTHEHRSSSNVSTLLGSQRAAGTDGVSRRIV